MEEGEVKTDIPSLGIFPSQFWVGQCIDIVSSHIGVAEVVVAHCQSTECGIGADALVGGFAITDTQFQVVHPFDRLHEVLTEDVPTCADSGIGVPLVSLGQA